MTPKDTGLFGRLIAAFRSPVEAPPAAPHLEDAPTRNDGEEPSIAILQMDLKERDTRIAAMQREYERLQLEVTRAERDAGKEQLESLCKRLCPPLATLAALRALAAEGKTVESKDVLSLVSDLERALAKAGLEQIGTVGETAEFESSAHQRMSGGDVHTGAAVVVRLPGYKLGGRVVLKAMVSAKGAANGPSRG